MEDNEISVGKGIYLSKAEKLQSILLIETMYADMRMGVYMSSCMMNMYVCLCFMCFVLQDKRI